MARTFELTDGGYGEAGSAFSNSQVYVGDFSTSFNFQFTPPVLTRRPTG